MTEGRKAVCEEMKRHAAMLRANLIAYTSGDLPDSEKETIALCMFHSLNWIKEGITVLLEESEK